MRKTQSFHRRRKLARLPTAGKWPHHTKDGQGKSQTAPVPIIVRMETTAKKIAESTP